MDKQLRIAEAGAVRAVLDGERRLLEVLAVPFGGPDRRDRLGQFFSPRTQVMFDVGDRRPTLYMHGLSPNMRRMKEPPVIGVAEVLRQDEKGWWMQAELGDSLLATRTWNAALQGRAVASTGSLNYLEDHDKATGEVLTWPVAELSVFDGGGKRVPVSDDAIVLPLRSLFAALDLTLPKVFEADEAGDTAEQEPALILDQGDNPMDDEVTKLSLAPEPDPEPEPEPEPKPAYRSTFSIKKETVGEPADNAKKETWEYVWHLRHGQYMPQHYRVLEESEALEGGPMVPADMLNEIVAMRDQASVASRAGLTRYTTDKLIFNIPRESTAMTRLAQIAEEGPYVANEAAFATLAVTVVKCGSMITATEELLEDQAMFQSWLVTACGRAWGLAENADLYTNFDLAASGTVGVTGSDTLTLAEFNTFFYFMTTPYRDGSVLIMNPGTMAALEGLLVATPYALGAYPDAPRTPMGLPTIRGCPVHLVSDWLLYTAAAANGLVLSMVNPAFAGIVERRGLSIKVDPYGDSLNGRVRYFPSVRFAPFVAQPLAHVIKNGA